MQRSIKTLLGLGARLPKELMLFVKNLMFLDGAIATLAPDLDLFAEIEAIALMFAAKHGERIMAQLGLEAQEDWAPDMAGFKAGFGLDESTESLTYRDIQSRRAQVREKFEGRRPRPRGGSGGARSSRTEAAGARRTITARALSSGGDVATPPGGVRAVGRAAAPGATRARARESRSSRPARGPSAPRR